MQIQLDQSTLPAPNQQVRFRKVGCSEWMEGMYIGEPEHIFFIGFEDTGDTVSVWDVEEWEPLELDISEAEQLRRHREALGLTQRQYPDIVGLSRDATISDWEKGKKPVPGFMKRIMQLEREVEALRKGRNR